MLVLQQFAINTNGFLDPALNAVRNRPIPQCHVKVEISQASLNSDNNLQFTKHLIVVAASL